MMEFDFMVESFYCISKSFWSS